MDIYFYNHFGYGDVHVSRSFVLDIMNKLPDNKYYYVQNPDRTSHFILHDLEKISHNSFDINKLSRNSQITQIGNSIFINTWYGQSDFKYFKITNECSFYVVYNIFTDIYKFLDLEIKNLEYYLPKIEYDNLEKKNIDNFFEKNRSENYILICDNPVLSGQSSNFDFKPIVNELANIYNNVNFITTSYNLSPRENIFSTNEIIGLEFDLNEISYLSTKCNVIVGRSSGPYTFCLTRQNLMNDKKKFVCFSNSELLGLGLYPNDHKCKLNWSSNFSYDNILKKIIQFI